jgi:hypothetical protein
MSAARTLARGGCQAPAEAFHRPTVLGETRPRLRRPEGPTPAGGPRSRGAWRQSHGAGLYRGCVGQLPLCGTPRGGRRQPSRVGPAGRRPDAFERARHGGMPVRSAGQSAPARRVREMPPLPPSGAHAAFARQRHRGLWRPRLRRGSDLPRRDRPSGPAAQASLRPRLPDADRDVSSLRQLSPEPAEHVHRQADSTNAAVGAAKGGRGCGTPLSPALSLGEREKRYFLNSLSNAARASSGVAAARLPVRSKDFAGA